MTLEDIESLLDKITPLPWLDYCISTGESWEREYRINNPEIGVDIARCGNDYTFSKSDSVFIAAAPTIIRELVERVNKLEGVMMDMADRLPDALNSCEAWEQKAFMREMLMEIRDALKEST